ncbi:MAG: type IV secretion system protein [Desulfarculales bacterium]|jgi:type IV secretion system protein VirB5|nr:type IV secretion system protein [Desulfarculales bacterium]
MNDSQNNPYLNGKQEWLERYGSYIKARAFWRAMAFLCVILAILATSGSIILIHQHKVVPYIVAVDSLGKSVAVGRADAASPVPARLIQAEIANIISNWRTVTADIDLQRRMLEKLSYFMAGSAKGQIKEWFDLNNPYQRAAKGTLAQITIKGVPHAVSSGSWRVEWTETVRNHTGVIIEVPRRYEATLAIQIQPPTTDEQILKNPGGIYVTELSFSTILENTN